MKTPLLLSLVLSAILSLANFVVSEAASEDPVVSLNPALKFTRKEPAKTGKFTKRVSFNVNGNDNWCGETDPWYDFGSTAPLASDCAQVANWWTYTSDGYWTLQPSDFSPSTGWAKVATVGTCSFAVKFQVSSQTTTTWIGTNDVHFFVTQVEPYAQNGKLGAQGTTSCYNGATALDLLWGLIHS
jgi:Pathogen effector